MVTKCCICGENIDLSRRAYFDTKENNHAHIHCADKIINVYKIQLVGGASYYEDKLPILEDLLRDSEEGESYTITKEKMMALEFKCLPEFTGF